MPTPRPLAALAVAVAVLAIVSGPLVGAVDLTRATPPAGAGDATVSVDSVPAGQIVLERSRFGAGRYHLSAPPAVVSVGSVDGNPVVRYTIDIPGLWTTATSRYQLADRSGERMGLRPNPVGISPQRIDQTRYNATVAIWLRTGDRERDLIQRRITVEVQR
ncbi:hypothetical protein ACFQL1_11845 [Halomicroarcula sp. GCM10025709]|uniref:hypothetical protein n=1 Tax=Haloarcula TaxID=2237 RepID=UPI0024C2A618|nr:hypothetical protein [Halomicroarcula sp. YJ-61-S]